MSVKNPFNIFRQYQPFPGNWNTNNTELCQREDTGLKSQPQQSLPNEDCANFDGPEEGQINQNNSALNQDQARSDLTPLASFNPSQRTFQMAHLPNPAQENLSKDPKEVLHQFLSSLNTAGVPAPKNNNKIATNSMLEQVQPLSGQNGSYQNSARQNTNFESFGNSQFDQLDDSTAFLENTDVQDFSQETNKVWPNAVTYARPELASTNSHKPLPYSYPSNPFTGNCHSSESQRRASMQNQVDRSKPHSGSWQNNFRSQSEAIKKVLPSNLYLPSLRDTSTTGPIQVNSNVLFWNPFCGTPTKLNYQFEAPLMLLLILEKARKNNTAWHS